MLCNSRSDSSYFQAVWKGRKWPAKDLGVGSTSARRQFPESDVSSLMSANPSSEAPFEDRYDSGGTLRLCIRRVSYVNCEGFLADT